MGGEKRPPVEKGSPQTETEGGTKLSQKKNEFLPNNVIRKVAYSRTGPERLTGRNLYRNQTVCGGEPWQTSSVDY